MLAAVVGCRALMREKIEIDRLVAGASTKLCSWRSKLSFVEPSCGPSREPAGVGDRNGKLGIHHTGHRRQKDRVIDLKELQQSSVRPHQHDSGIGSYKLARSTALINSLQLKRAPRRPRRQIRQQHEKRKKESAGQ